MPSLTWGFQATAPDTGDYLSIEVERQPDGKANIQVYEITDGGGQCINWDLTPHEFWTLTKVFQQAWEQHYDQAD